MGKDWDLAKTGNFTEDGKYYMGCGIHQRNSNQPSEVVPIGIFAVLCPVLTRIDEGFTDAGLHIHPRESKTIDD